MINLFWCGWCVPNLWSRRLSRRKENSKFPTASLDRYKHLQSDCVWLDLIWVWLLSLFACVKLSWSRSISCNCNSSSLLESNPLALFILSSSHELAMSAEAVKHSVDSLFDFFILFSYERCQCANERSNRTGSVGRWAMRQQFLLIWICRSTNACKLYMWNLSPNLLVHNQTAFHLRCCDMINILGLQTHALLPAKQLLLHCRTFTMALLLFSMPPVTSNGLARDWQGYGNRTY